MSDEQPADATEQAQDRPQRKLFRNKFNVPRLSPESAERQGRVTLLAWQMLGGRDGAMAFLNNHDDTLGGRPLDLAVASAAGCEAVEQAIAARSTSAEG
ncbi:hypothetical protein ACMGDH_13465 [Sphingomonas sp. DT-207]|uniref:hypothetical protein n=1 Tax=Sphingomonas sp. DT-207 TaxID=3396167 RepID=UPI003F1C21E9